MSDPIITEILSDKISFEMIFGEGGEFIMGSEEEKALNKEKPIHMVKLSSYYIGKYLVTQALWKAVMGPNNNPSYFKGDNRPVEMVSWEKTQEFIEKLNTLTSRKYRLLTEAEWEYAARGGLKSQGYKYAGSNRLKNVGWCNKNSDKETKPVGLKDPNELELFDLSGNVYEWCYDSYSISYYEECKKHGIVENPTGPKGIEYIIRGGSWYGPAQFCRVSYRDNYGSRICYGDIGFRLGLSC